MIALIATRIQTTPVEGVSKSGPVPDPYKPSDRSQEIAALPQCSVAVAAYNTDASSALYSCCGLMLILRTVFG
jgi:hypothetical protein